MLVKIHLVRSKYLIICIYSSRFFGYLFVIKLALGNEPQKRDMNSNNTILVVDDAKSICSLLHKIFKKDYDVLFVQTGEDALEEIETKSVDLVLLDQNMPGCGGIETLKRIKLFDDKIPVIMMTAFGKIELSVEAIKLGARDYIEKPFDPEKIKIAVSNAIGIRNLSNEVDQLRSELTEKYNFQNIIGKSSSMQAIFHLISSIASTDISTVITGESGTGKELVARAIHYSGNFKNTPFIPINCAAIPDDLLESELFGYEKGAFSGAISTKKGKVELADKGTLFLDEIADMAENTQAKLLRFLQDGRFERLGGEKTIQVNVRILSATNKNIEELIEEKRFREDLFYRINGIQIELPSLNRRKEDIPLLINNFIKTFNSSYNKNITGIEPETMRSILNYDWPGNVRELESAIQSAIILSTGELIDSSSLPKRIVTPSRITIINNTDDGISFEQAMEETEKRLIKDALENTQNNRTKAADLLQISLRNLQYKMKKYGLGNNNLGE